MLSLKKTEVNLWTFIHNEHNEMSVCRFDFQVLSYDSEMKDEFDTNCKNQRMND